jgi:predicted DNA-binding transcriptional regulator AlpA
MRIASAILQSLAPAQTVIFVRITMPADKPLKTPERVRADDVASITGLKLRTVQSMADRGLIPSAAKLGAVWTFDERAVRQWVKLKEEEAQSAAPISRREIAEQPASSLARRTAAESETAYEQLFARRRTSRSHAEYQKAYDQMFSGKRRRRQPTS